MKSDISLSGLIGGANSLLMHVALYVRSISKKKCGLTFVLIFHIFIFLACEELVGTFSDVKN